MHFDTNRATPPKSKTACACERIQLPPLIFLQPAVFTGQVHCETDQCTLPGLRLIHRRAQDGVLHRDTVLCNSSFNNNTKCHDLRLETVISPCTTTQGSHSPSTILTHCGQWAYSLMCCRFLCACSAGSTSSKPATR